MNPPEQTVYDFTARSIDGVQVPLSRYQGKVLLIVNVASRCGHTPQYEGLEQLHRTFRDRGFTVLGFPSNDFGAQEPGSDAEIKAFCSATYDVSFDLFSKIAVKGKEQHPLYRFLTAATDAPEFAGEIRWNFTKFLVDRQGKIIGRFAPGVDPGGREIGQAIEAALQPAADTSQSPAQ
jgi:glutathione peroxidase